METMTLSSFTRPSLRGIPREQLVELLANHGVGGAQAQLGVSWAELAALRKFYAIPTYLVHPAQRGIMHALAESHPRGLKLAQLADALGPGMQRQAIWACCQKLRRHGFITKTGPIYFLTEKGYREILGDLSR